ARCGILSALLWRRASRKHGQRRVELSDELGPRNGPSMTSSTKRREAPSEPLKRVLAPAVRAIAGDGEIEVDFGPGKGDVAGKSVHLPDLPRAPSAKDIALARGWADSLALRIGCHDAKLHRRIAPPSGPARVIFEAAERARVEGLGSVRMPGMAANLTARL